MLVTLEGIDGSGKGTQTKLLMQAAERRGFRTASFSFPQYGANAYGKVVTDYLNGHFGQLHEVSPYLSAILFAGDRLASRDALIQALKLNEIVICDRYVESNLAHQAAKLCPGQRAAFISWLSEIEYDIHRLPRPDLTVLLSMPVDFAHQLVLKKPGRNYTAMAADIHERDSDYLQACEAVYLSLAAVTGGPGWRVIGCVQGAALRPEAEIAAEIWDCVSQLLPAQRPGP